MAGKQGQEPKPLGQRSISSMFSNSRVAAGRSGNGRPLPLMEFLNRKSEKRTLLQGCVVNAGLTPEVIERLDAVRKNDIRSSKQFEKNESSHRIKEVLRCSEDAIWPLKRNLQSLWSEGSQLFNILKSKPAGVGIGEKSTSGQGDGIGECSTSSCLEKIPISKYRRMAQAYAESSNSKLDEGLDDTIVVSHVLGNRRSQVQTPPNLEVFRNRSSSSSAVEPRYDPAKFQGGHDLDGHLQKTGAHHLQPLRMDFVDLTEDEDPAVEGLEGGSYLQESTEIHRKRKRSPPAAAHGATERCPVCNEHFPPDMLQAHVESELDALDMLGTNSVHEGCDFTAGGNEYQDMRHVDESVGAWEDHARSPGRSVQFKEPSSRVRPRQSMLVLGDEPKYRRPNFRLQNKRPNSTFNHYADGAGWFDEGGVGVDAEAVGSASVWEGLGSMSFGGNL